MAERLELNPEEIGPLLQAASLHDIGKAAIPDAILDKPAPLNQAEWTFMRTHTLIGERILCAAPALTEAARLVRSSHERWDGAGYPDGLTGSTRASSRRSGAWSPSVHPRSVKLLHA